MIEIPILSETSADVTLEIELDGVLTTIRLLFNVRNQDWFFTVTTENYTITLKRIVIDYLILRQYKANFPELPGDFVVKKINESAEDNLTYDNLGNDYALYYYDVNEVNEWLEENNLS